MIVLLCIAVYLAISVLLGRRLKRQGTPAPHPQLELVRDEQLDIETALRRPSR